MVGAVRVTGAKAPCAHWVLWGPDLLTAHLAALRLTKSDCTEEMEKHLPSSTPPNPLGTPTPCSLSLVL